MRTIALTSAALDTGITLGDLNLSIRTLKNPAWADGKTYPATVTYFRPMS
ncbi:MAG TPA: hypothetical protein PLX02_05390 [Syntrophorhabdaceae bacterium]|nr:hypothetical protein [Syntrophorhabdaceae bacterium]HQM81038.1 hypothetical protein [Syntrophorhabdaceae bacterium]